MYHFLTVLITAMLPVAELRVAIPLGVALGLKLRYTALVAMIGNMLPIPWIIHFIKYVFTWLRKKNLAFDRLVVRFEQIAHLKSGIIEKYGYLGLLILTAIPLPGTGAWTAALVAAMLELETRKSFLFIAVGVVFAGVLVTFMTAGVREVI